MKLSDIGNSKTAVTRLAILEFCIGKKSVTNDELKNASGITGTKELNNHLSLMNKIFSAAIGIENDLFLKMKSTSPIGINNINGSIYKSII